MDSRLEDIRLKGCRKRAQGCKWYDREACWALNGTPRGIRISLTKSYGATGSPSELAAAVSLSRERSAKPANEFFITLQNGLAQSTKLFAPSLRASTPDTRFCPEVPHRRFPHDPTSEKWESGRFFVGRWRLVTFSYCCGSRCNPRFRLPHVGFGRL